MTWKELFKEDSRYYQREFFFDKFWDFVLSRPNRLVCQYIYHMRRIEAYKGRPWWGKLIAFYHYYRYNKLGYKLGFQIPPGTCGKGLTIYHYGFIVVNYHARLGDYCRLYPGVVIGSTDTGYPIIGSNVFIGASSKIIGGIKIGNNVIIAPNSVVNKDVPSNCIVAGSPAKIVKNITKDDYPRLSGYLRPFL